MTRLLLMMTCACAAAFGVSTHAFGNDVAGVQAQYAHVTGAMSHLHSDLSQDASATETGLTALRDGPVGLGNAAQGGQASGH